MSALIENGLIVLSTYLHLPDPFSTAFEKRKFDVSPICHVFHTRQSLICISIILKNGNFCHLLLCSSCYGRISRNRLFLLGVHCRWKENFSLWRRPTIPGPSWGTPYHLLYVGLSIFMLRWGSVFGMGRKYAK